MISKEITIAEVTGLFEAGLPRERRGRFSYVILNKGTGIEQTDRRLKS